MKFGKYLREKRAALEVEWQDRCIDYDSLKKYLKSNVMPCSLRLYEAEPFYSQTGAESSGYVSAIRDRLAALQEALPCFIQLLDAEVQKLNSSFVAEMERLQNEYRHLEGTQFGERAKVLLRDILTLEQYVFLNFTGICKILKKADKISGAPLTESYMSRLSSLEFYTSHGISKMKRNLMQTFGGVVPGLMPSPPATPVTNDILLSRGSIAEGQNRSLSSSSSTLPPNPTWFPPLSILPHQKIIITLSGAHGTDISGALLAKLSQYDIQLDDLNFSRMYHNVTFTVLVHLQTEDVQLFRSLADAAKEWDAELKFDVYNEHEKLPKSLADAPYPDRLKYTATVLNSNGLTVKFLSSWTSTLLKYKISIESMKRLNEDGRVSVIDMKLSVPQSVDFDVFRAEVFHLGSSSGTDIALQPDNVFRRSKRLVIMDMDSTLIQQEVIDELAKHCGVVSEVAKITHSAMNGEIDFKESLRKRVALLSGAPSNILEQVRSELKFTEGAHFLCKALKKLGYKLAVISGGFLPLANYVKNELGLDYAFANQLKVSADGKTLLGETVGPIVDAERKAELLEVIAQAESVCPEQVVAIGDGANDLIMLAAAGLGIAFNAKPKVQEKARTRINQRSLRNILYLLGYSDEEIAGLA